MLRLLRIKLSPLCHYNNNATNFPSFFSKLSTTSSSKAAAAAAAAAAADPSTIAATAAFLEDSCGLSTDAALSLAKNRPLKSTAKARSVLALLESHGFGQADIARILVREPRLLSINPEKVAKPKLAFLQSAGLLELFLENPWLLRRGLDTVLVPNFELLRSVLRSNAKVLEALKRAPRLIVGNPAKIMLPRMGALRSHGVTDPVMVLLFTKYGYIFQRATKFFEAALAVVKETGISPTSSVFAHALGVLVYLPKRLWEEKLENYRNLGWSLEQTLFAFSRYPHCMFASMEKVNRNMRFLEEELKWGPEYVSKYPVFLALSLQKRIIPRYNVLRNLMSNGLVKGAFPPSCFLISNNDFQTRYIIKYHDKVPELVADFACCTLAVEGSKEDPVEAM